MTNSVDPDQTAPIGAVWSGSTQFASILKFVSNVRQLFAADNFSRRQFSNAFFLGALRVRLSWLFFMISTIATDGCNFGLFKHSWNQFPNWIDQLWCYFLPSHYHIHMFDISAFSVLAMWVGESIDMPFWLFRVRPKTLLKMLSFANFWLKQHELWLACIKFGLISQLHE